MSTYVRFETPYHCDASRQGLGIFRAAAVVEVRAELPEWTREWLSDRFSWFRTHLPVPRHGGIDHRAIFWFRPEARIVSEMWHLVAILREEGVSVALRRTKLPGRIVYQDEFQIAAIPYGHGRRPRRARLLRLI
jgi:hypothetical protein